MALSIIPGYDFGVNEVPNRETVLRQAKMVQISGVGLSLIDTSLIGMVAAATSGTTGSSLPSPGWIWADPGGSWWVETDHGPVKMKREGGGYESVRWGRNSTPEVQPPQPGSPWLADVENVAAQQTEGISLTAGGSEAVAMWDSNWNDSNGGAITRNLMLNAETAASTSSFPRLIGRGLTFIFVGGETHDFCMRRAGGMRITGSVNEWVGGFVTTESNFPETTGSTREHWYGVFVAPDSGTSFTAPVNAQLHGSVHGWKYDQAVWGPGAAI